MNDNPLSSHPLTGDLFIAGQRVAHPEETFSAVAAATGSTVEPPFSIATDTDVATACEAAEAAFPTYAALPRDVRACFLDTIADQIEAVGDALVERAAAETGLPIVRLRGELARTTAQLRMFAGEICLGDYLRVRIDHAIPARQPMRKPDLRLRMVPVGPVAVFGASNFPLAFSVVGGDTAAALAAGCTVVAKGHPAHPGTSEIVAAAIMRAADRCQMPSGVFSLLNGPSHSLGEALVRDEHIRAVGFTGSRKGGSALAAIAANRPVPIPVFAEMSSVNPVFLLPHALEAQAEALGRDYVASVTLGAGQFCTNPGLVFAVEGSGLDRFLDSAASAMAATPAQVMLTPGILAAYDDGISRWSVSSALRLLARGAAQGGATEGQGALFTMAGRDFLADRSHAEEVFGATSLVVRCADHTELETVIARLEGQLTATLHVADGDTALARTLVPMLERLAGRILVNGWPTGVEVTDAQVHGGPYPATSDGRSTSVGTMAIDRFLRPVAYQDFPTELLPADLLDKVDISRRIDGVPVRGRDPECPK